MGVLLPSTGAWECIPSVTRKEGRFCNLLSSPDEEQSPEHCAIFYCVPRTQRSSATLGVCLTPSNMPSVVIKWLLFFFCLCFS